MSVRDEVEEILVKKARRIEEGVTTDADASPDIFNLRTAIRELGEAVRLLADRIEEDRARREQTRVAEPQDRP
jgi:hypothetical protein